MHLLKGVKDMTIAEMNEKKRELGYSYEQISEISGVPLATVQKVLSGITRSPRHKTLVALEAAFKTTKRPSEKEEELYNNTIKSKISMLNESEAAYSIPEKKQGEYTVVDYYAIPDERRVELIDGVIYDMGAPLSVHQLIVGEMFRLLRNMIQEKEGSCLPFISPVDVQLDCDNKTMVQPDVLVVCDRDKVIRRCIYGAPDLIIEVLSPSTKKKDMRIKAYKYANAGVREYWLIDPDTKQVLVYDFEHDAMPAIYTFESTIPIGIFGDDFTIDFSKIYEYIAFIYDRDE